MSIIPLPSARLATMELFSEPKRGRIGSMSVDILLLSGGAGRTASHD
jgi:hypothetical protein